MENKIHKTRVPYDVVARVLKEMGATVLYDGSEVLLPSGGLMLIFPSLDGGTDYMLLSRDADTIKFVQKAMAKANLIVKKGIEPQPQKAEAEEKEERKKGTEEVSEFVSGTSDSVHGGDSASGEVPEGESGKGQDSPSSESLALPQDGAGSEVEEGSASSEASSLSPDLSSKEEGESCPSDSSEPSGASEGEGSSDDGACPKSSECTSLDVEGEGDAPMDGQASIGEGTGSLASSLGSEDPASEDILEDILGVDLQEPELWEPGELSTLPSPSGAEDEGEAPAPEGEVSPSLSFKDLKKIFGKIMVRGYQPPSGQSRYNFGGISANLSILNGVPLNSLVSKARRVLARLVSEYGDGEEGPRWDYKKISTRIASYQNWRVSDRKKEMGRPAIAVLPDVSGSMGLFAKQVLEFSKILMALGVPGAEVMTVVQSNGFPLELWVNRKRVESTNTTYEYTIDHFVSEETFVWYEKVFRLWNVKVVVLAADWDGEWLYLEMAKRMDVRIYWLDVKGSPDRKLTVVNDFPPRWMTYTLDWDPQAASKVVYVCNCNDVVDFVKGLELAIRSQRNKK
jgi:hypothetical protein